MDRVAALGLDQTFPRKDSNWLRVVFSPVSVNQSLRLFQELVQLLLVRREVGAVADLNVQVLAFLADGYPLVVHEGGRFLLFIDSDG